MKQGYRVLFEEYGAKLWVADNDSLILGVLCGGIAQFGVDFELNESEREQYRLRGDVYIQELVHRVLKNPTEYAQRGKV